MKHMQWEKHCPEPTCLHSTTVCPWARFRMSLIYIVWLVPPALQDYPKVLVSKGVLIKNNNPQSSFLSCFLIFDESMSWFQISNYVPSLKLRSFGKLLHIQLYDISPHSWWMQASVACGISFLPIYILQCQIWDASTVAWKMSSACSLRQHPLPPPPYHLPWQELT